MNWKLCLFLQKQDFSSLFIHSIYPLKYIHTIPSTSHRLHINFSSPTHIKTSPVEIMGSESASLAPVPLCLPISTPLSSNSNSRVPPSHSLSVLPLNLTSLQLLSRFPNNVSQVIWIAKSIQIQRIFPETAFECSLTLPTCSPPAYSKHND